MVGGREDEAPEILRAAGTSLARATESGAAVSEFDMRDRVAVPRILRDSWKVRDVSRQRAQTKPAARNRPRLPSERFPIGSTSVGRALPPRLDGVAKHTKNRFPFGRLRSCQMLELIEQYDERSGRRKLVQVDEALV